MQLLCQIDTPDFAGWKAAYDAADHDGSGLTQMQIWRGADASSKVVILFEVSNRKSADEWLTKMQAFGGSMTKQYLETV